MRRVSGTGPETTGNGVTLHGVRLHADVMWIRDVAKFSRLSRRVAAVSNLTYLATSPINQAMRSFPGMCARASTATGRRHPND
jgi:hypothetical protein